MESSSVKLYVWLSGNGVAHISELLYDGLVLEWVAIPLHG